MRLTFRELRSAKVALSLADLTHRAVSLQTLLHSTPERSLKAPDGHYKFQNCEVKFIGFYKRALKWHITYNVVCSEKYSSPKGHTVKLMFIPTPGISDILDLDVKVSCSCEAFVYWGAQWEVHGRDALERPYPKLKAPDPSKHNYPDGTPNPNDQRDYVICKHIAAATDRVNQLLKRHVSK